MIRSKSYYKTNKSFTDLNISTDFGRVKWVKSVFLQSATKLCYNAVENEGKRIPIPI